MRDKKIFFMIGLITLILGFQACVPTTTSSNEYSEPTNLPPETANSEPIKTNTPQNTPTKSYFALGTVTVDLCNLRKGPSTYFPIIEYSEKGKVHKIYGINPEKTWLLLDENKSIWIALSLVSLDTDISSIPVINNLSSLIEFTNTKEPYQNMGEIPTQSIEQPEPNQNMVEIPTQSFEQPEPTQVVGCPYGCTYHPPGCDIKGNISYTTNEKIYHVPGGRFYNDTVISPEYGERWFCTEEEALSNGWRKSSQ